MEQRRRVLTVGATAVMAAIFVRLMLLGTAGEMPGLISAMVFLQTGRVVRWTTPVSTEVSISTEVATIPETTVPPETEATEPAALPAFSQADAENIRLNDQIGSAPSVQTLLEMPINWQLCGAEPTVLILHTHATECYAAEEGESYKQSGFCRTLDEQYNMVSIGEALAEKLRAGGITVIHDKTLHDYPSYTGAYELARKTIARYLEAYPSITMVIDLHRDALSENSAGLCVVGEVDGQEAAKLMVVAGSNKKLEYADWQENLALGVQLTAILERENPGITRPVQLRAQRFNLDMTPGSLLIEVGGNGNTHTQALRAMDALAQGILALAQGTNG